MCGIVCAFNLKQPVESLRPKILQMSKKIRHRGPDWSGIYSNNNAIIAHERLAIVDPTSGKQPLFQTMTVISWLQMVKYTIIER